MTRGATSWWGDLPEHFRRFAAESVAQQPTYHRIAEAAADDPEVLSLLDPAPPAQRRAVLLLAAVHYLVLADPASELGRHYRSVGGGPQADGPTGPGDPWPAFRGFALEHRSEIERLVATRSVQTNEVGRSLALWPALAEVQRRAARPLALVELGASAGLNLVLDRYRLEYAQPDGTIAVAGDAASVLTLRARVHGDRPVPLGEAPLAIGSRIGVDVDPVDLAEPDDVRWLEACVFPDRVDRLERLRAAVALAAHQPPPVERGDAVERLGPLAAAADPDHALVVLHTWAITYFPDPQALADELGCLAETRRVWWVSVEAPRAVPGLLAPRRDPSLTEQMAPNTVTGLVELGPGGRRHDHVLARSHPHLDWLQWLGDARAGSS